MKISIITPSYNQADFLEQTILSVWKQKGNFEIEHILADGESTDNSLSIIKKYEKLYQNNKYKFACKKFTFMCWSKKDKGQTDALNKGFQIAKGEIFAWLNSDDTYENPLALQKITEAFKKNRADIVIGNTYAIDQKNKRLENPPIYCNDFDNAHFQKYLPNILNNCFIPQPGTFFKKEIYQEFKLNNYHYGMDWDLWIRCYLAKKKFLKIKAPIANFRIHFGAKTTDAGVKYYRETIAVLKKYNPNSNQILINQILLYKERLINFPILGNLINGCLKTYLFFKFKVLKRTMPLFSK